LRTINKDYAQRLIDFAPSKEAMELGFGESQLDGAVAAYNMLARNKIAYLADEVGMGKTYVALGAMGLMRHLDPAARIMVIAPRENIQRKWEKELSNFIRLNWLVEDNRVKGLDGKPVHKAIHCGSIGELGQLARTGDQGDMFLRMTTFSLATKQSESRKKYRKRLLDLLPWVDRGLISARSDPNEFRDAYGRILNALIPDIDLLVVDEAHNLKHGFGPKVSNRNRILGLTLGHSDGRENGCHWFRPRVKRVLLLSATPFEYDFGDIYRQFDVFGFAGAKVRDLDDGDPLPLHLLCDTETTEEMKKEIIGRLLLRRVAYLNIADTKYSKNMYRREWRCGGLDNHDEPMEMTDTKHRLIVGLIQKKVAEVLGDKRFNNSFQIGMLSSFESFFESMAHLRRRKPKPSTVGEEKEEPIFDGDQEATAEERRGIDTYSLESVVSSYRRIFHRSLPHPKQDATVAALADVFDTGEKALIFVRRVATVKELKNKLDSVFDRWVRRRFDDVLPHLKAEIDEIFGSYRESKTLLRGDVDLSDSSHGDMDQVEEERLFPIEEDEGGTDSFFAWFFRGKGPSEILSGAAFQKNRLSSISSAYSTLFEDDYVSGLFGHPEDPLTQLACAINLPLQKVISELRKRAFGFFSKRTKRKEGYPRFYVFEAYQVAALRLLAERDGELGSMARTILDERFTSQEDASVEPLSGFPSPDELIGQPTFFSELAKRRSLRERIWPVEEGSDFRQRFRRQEMRRELISAMSRLGASYIDLYLLAIKRLGSFRMGGKTQEKRPEVALISDYLDLLQTQSGQSVFGAYRELSSAADTFENLLNVNFPGAPYASLSELALIFGRTLQHQMPGGSMAGGVNKRLVHQFRMPGFPLVLATTDVLQEGEDLHTFCRRVIHYGITWTPSAMEQRTGRIDRIGGLVQRELDGRRTVPRDDEFIQVYFPHLADTVEVIQVQRVLERLDKFFGLIHSTRPGKESDRCRIDVAEEVLQRCSYPRPVEGLLESAFPVKPEWLKGRTGSEGVLCPDIGSLEAYLKKLWTGLVSRLQIQNGREESPRCYSGSVSIAGDHIACDIVDLSSGEFRRQSFKLELRSQVMGSRTLLRCTSPVGSLSLTDSKVLDRLYELQRDFGMVKVCARYNVRRRKYRITIEGDRLFVLKTTQPEEIEDLLRRVIVAADRLENDLLGSDDDFKFWPTEGEEETDE